MAHGSVGEAAYGVFKECFKQFPEVLNDNVKLDYQGRIQIFTYVLPFAYVLLLHDGALEGDSCHGGHAFLAATTGL